MNSNIIKDIELLEELRKQEDTAVINGAYMEEVALYDSVVRLVKSILTTLISSYGSGTIASFIGSTKYAEIDKAVTETLLFLFHAEDEQLHDLKVDNESIKELVYKCYKGELKDNWNNYFL